MYYLSILMMFLLGSMTNCTTQKAVSTSAELQKTVSDTLKPRITKKKKYDTKQWTNVIEASPSIGLDIRYATPNNFTKAKIYDCAACYLRPAVAAALAKAHENLQKQGLGIKVFDCYRPRPYQQRLWDKVPNPDYVTPPAKGSMHNRGMAVDLTIVDKNGKELEMGTPYDFFGEKAHHDYGKLPKDIQANRTLLLKTMEQFGFKHIRTEWWHYSFEGNLYDFSDWVWECE